MGIAERSDADEVMTPETSDSQMTFKAESKRRIEVAGIYRCRKLLDNSCVRTLV